MLQLGDPIPTPNRVMNVCAVAQLACVFVPVVVGGPVAWHDIGPSKLAAFSCYLFTEGPGPRWAVPGEGELPP